MNPKNSRKSQVKTQPKKKVKTNAKPSQNQTKNVPVQSETKSKFYVDETQKDVVKVPDEPKKLERSNSFYLTRTLSKIYSKLSGSRESLDKVTELKPPEAKQPFKFQRSLTLNSIQLKKNYRQPLEKLSEEKLENDKPNSPPVKLRTKSTTTNLPSNSPTTFRQSMPPVSFECVDFGFLKPPPKLERSDSFISLIKRKISFNESKPSATLNSNWATSLQNLQQIDNMVSYEDLSFVDYDKFNQYEQQIDKMLNRRQRKTGNVAEVVVRRRPKKSYDFNTNLDRDKNLYRSSIDSNKLRFLSSINLDSHRWSLYNDPIDWLSLENQPQAFNPIL
jgi:hypothetical protein